MEAATQELKEALKALKATNTQEELEIVRDRVNKARENLLQVSRGLRNPVEGRGGIDGAGIPRPPGISSPTGFMFPQSANPIAASPYACPKCFTTDINTKMISRRKARLRKTSRNIPFCIKCNTDMVKMSREMVKEKRMSKILKV